MPTRTQKQVAELAALPTHKLIAEGLTALHALNRRAKDKRDRAKICRRARFADAFHNEMREIYDLKDRFLEAMVIAGLASVETFDRESDFACCPLCKRKWAGPEDCGECGVAGQRELERWYVIDCGSGFRFHQPARQVSDAVATRAVACPPHDPTQPRREVPKLKLTIAAQVECVQLATQRLCEMAPRRTPSDGRR